MTTTRQDYQLQCSDWNSVTSRYTVFNRNIYNTKYLGGTKHTHKRV